MARTASITSADLGTAFDVGVAHMTTSILQLPIAILSIQTETNADWLDGLEYMDGGTPSLPIDLTGIQFEMEMRLSPPFATVVLRAATDNGLIRVVGNTWQLLVPSTVMMLIPPGNYSFDMLARADGYTRNVVQATVTITLGITRTDLPSTTITGAQQPVDGMPYAPVPGTTIGPVA
jgi:hypothetical protein